MYMYMHMYSRYMYMYMHIFALPSLSCNLSFMYKLMYTCRSYH